MTVYAYIRVSTDKQDCANQKLGVDAKAKALGLTINKYIEDDGISGTKEPEKRALGKLLKILRPGDVIIVSELSRFGRKLFMLFRILERLVKSLRVFFRPFMGSKCQKFKRKTYLNIYNAW